MALKLIESFGDSNTELFTIKKKWDSSSVYGTSSLMPGRVPEIGNSLRFAGSLLQSPVFGDHATWIVGFAFWDNLDSGTVLTMLKIMDDSTAQVELKYDTTTRLFSIYSGATELDVASGVGLTQRTWYYIELKVTIHASTGSVYLKINETQVASATGQDTQITANATANNISFHSTSAETANAYRIDDIYICDGSSSPSDFLGDCKVEPIIPSSEHSVMWSVNGSSSQSNIDAVQADSGSNISTATADDQDTYYFNDVTKAKTSIKAVCVNIIARNNDATSHQIKAACIGSVGTPSLGSTQSLSGTSFSTYSEFYTTDPETATAWTESGVNGAKFGVKYIGTV